MSAPLHPRWGLFRDIPDGALGVAEVLRLDALLTDIENAAFERIEDEFPQVVGRSEGVRSALCARLAGVLADMVVERTGQAFGAGCAEHEETFARHLENELVERAGSQEYQFGDAAAKRLAAASVAESAAHLAGIVLAGGRRDRLRLENDHGISAARENRRGERRRTILEEAHAPQP